MGEVQLTVVVPVFNEEQTIERILGKLVGISLSGVEIIVVDDASTDNSHHIINDFFEHNDFENYRLLRNEQNMGKGAGMRLALKHAKGRYFVVQDADLEYDPVDIVPIVQHALANDLDVVYGSRFIGKIKNMPKANYYANKFYNFLLRFMYDTEITDMHTCYKLVRTEIMREINLQSDGFEYASELISKLLNKGYKINEVPISFSGRTRKQGKKIDYKDGIKCAITLVSYRLKI